MGEGKGDFWMMGIYKQMVAYNWFGFFYPWIKNSVISVGSCFNCLLGEAGAALCSLRMREKRARDFRGNTSIRHSQSGPSHHFLQVLKPSAGPPFHEESFLFGGGPQGVFVLHSAMTLFGRSPGTAPSRWRFQLLGRAPG